VRAHGRARAPGRCSRAGAQRIRVQVRAAVRRARGPPTDEWPNSSSPSSTAGAAPAHSSPALGLVIGLVLGLSLLVVLAGAACFVVRGRRRRRHALALRDTMNFNTKLDRHAVAVRRAVDGSAGR
jgi:hypothetical protein